MQRRLVAFALLAILVCAAALYVFYFVYGAGQRLHLELHNMSSETIERGTVSLFGSEHVFGPVGPGKSLTLSFPFDGEGGYQIEATFASGKTVASGSIGYLTPGMSSDDGIEISPDGISLLPPETDGR